jgi:hypothetical protein
VSCRAVRLYVVINAAHRLGWSDWRRRHQARARTSHYWPQAATPAMKITIYSWSIKPDRSVVHRAALFALNGSDHASLWSEASMICMYIVSLDKHAYDERLHHVVDRGKRCLRRH